MHRTLYILTWLICFVETDSLRAQNIQFSQFEVLDPFLNPAITGQYFGDWQLALIHRDQWRSIADPFVSSGISFDRHFYYYSRQINAGLLFVHDQSGAARLTSDKIYFSLAYPMDLGKSVVTAGIQPGFVIKYFDRSDITFPLQYDHSIGYFNKDLENMESPYNNFSISYFDINAGLNWQLNLPRLKPSVGFALYHIGQPNESFNSGKNRLSIRQVIQGSMYYSLKNGLYLRPSFTVQKQNTANMTVIGSDFGKNISGSESGIRELFAGLYLRDGFNRNNDALIPILGLKYNNWRIGMSYDINISQLKVATETRGAYELSIVYTAPSTIPKHSSIPCERY